MKYFKDENGEVYAYRADGSQDHVIKPGLIPLTAEEVEAHTNPPVDELKLAETQAILIVQTLLDTKAQTYGYDDIKSAVTYADEPSVIKFQLEGIAFREWRSLCWDYCYSLLDEVKQTGVIPTPEEFKEGLPQFKLDPAQEPTTPDPEEKSEQP